MVHGTWESLFHISSLKLVLTSWLIFGSGNQLLNKTDDKYGITLNVCFFPMRNYFLVSIITNIGHSVIIIPVIVNCYTEGVFERGTSSV